MKKNQHYVPKMILKRFEIPTQREKSWEYNLHTKKITVKCIDEVCSSKYFYEIRNEAGEYYYPDGKNKLEDGFCKIETIYSPFWDELIARLDGCTDSIKLSMEEIESICLWVSILIMRNPVIKNVIPEVAKEFGETVQDKMSKSYLFVDLLPKGIEFMTRDLLKGHISFLRAPKESGFVIADIPVILGEPPVHEFSYTPISKNYAIQITAPKSVAVDVRHCVIRDLSRVEMVDYNNKVYSAMLNAYDFGYLQGASILSHSRDLLESVVLPGFFNNI